MRKNKRMDASAAMLAIWLMCLAVPAQAYIDPGTGSVVTTTILGFIGAAAYTVRKRWYRIKDFFAGKKADRPDESGPRDR